jgi:aspartate aminotransferase
MAICVSHRVKSIKPSPTLTVSAMAKKMMSEGIDVINFGVGEPDFNTPEYIKQSGIKAINDNFTRYTITSGIPELRQAICDKFKRDNKLDYEPDQILVSPGAKASIINILMAVCDPRDEIFVPVPYWVSYISQINLVDAVPIFLPTNEFNNFRITAAQLQDAIDGSCNPKAIILNTPNNPTGSVYTKKELLAIAEVCLKNDILIIADEIYEKLVYDGGEHVSIASLSPEIKEITVVVNGVSKAFAMTGWRVGYVAGPKEIIKKAGLIQGHTTSCVNSIAQKATVSALNDEDGSIEKMREEFDDRRKYIYQALNEINNVSCVEPKGAFYAMPNISYYIMNNKKGIKNSAQLCEYLLQKFHIAIVAGSAFGVDNYVRFSYANSLENIIEGVKRFKDGLYSLI